MNVAPHPPSPLPRPLPLRPPSPTQDLHESPTTSHQSRRSYPHESPATSHKSRLFMCLPALQLSCLSFSHPRPLFSIVCGLFYKNTGGGIPLPDLYRSHPASHKSRPSPDFRRSQVTNHQSRLGKSFTIRSCQFRLKIPHCTGRKFPTPNLHRRASLASDGVEPSAVFWRVLGVTESEAKERAAASAPSCPRGGTRPALRRSFRR